MSLLFGSSDGYEVGDIRVGYADSDDGRWKVANNRKLNGVLYPQLANKWFNQVNTVISIAEVIYSCASDNAGMILTSGTSPTFISGNTIQFRKSLDGGVTWQNAGTISNPVVNGTCYCRVKYVNGFWIAMFYGTTLGNEPTIPNGFWSSPDGTTWTQRSSNTASLYDVTYGNGTYLFTTSPNYSNNLLWKTTAIGTAITSVAAYSVTPAAGAKLAFWVPNHNLFYATNDAAAGGNMRSSPDAITWSNTTLAMSPAVACFNLGNELAVYFPATGAMNTYYSSLANTPTQVQFTTTVQGWGPMNLAGDWLVKDSGTTYYAYKSDGSAFYSFTNTSLSTVIVQSCMIPGGGLLVTYGASGAYRLVCDTTIANLPSAGNSSWVTAGTVLQTSYSTQATTAKGYVMKVKP